MKDCITIDGLSTHMCYRYVCLPSLKLQSAKSQQHQAEIVAALFLNNRAVNIQQQLRAYADQLTGSLEYHCDLKGHCAVGPLVRVETLVAV